MGKERKRDAGWDHAIDESRFKTKCKWCGRVVSSGGVTRLKIQLTGVGGNATACTGCSNEVRLAMKELVRAVQISCSKSKPKTAEPNFDHNYDAGQLPDGNSNEDDERGEFKMPTCQTPEALNSNNQGSHMHVVYQIQIIKALVCMLFIRVLLVLTVRMWLGKLVQTVKQFLMSSSNQLLMSSYLLHDSLLSEWKEPAIFLYKYVSLSPNEDHRWNIPAESFFILSVVKIC